jgi:hypothetical protein
MEQCGVKGEASSRPLPAAEVVAEIDLKDCSPEAERVPGRQRLASVLAACYLLLQIALPLILLARPGRRPADFSWDMFSHRLSCSKIEARANVPGGRSGSVRLDLDFTSWAQASRVFFPGRIEDYGRYLCEQLRIGEGRSVELHFLVECRDDRHGPLRPVVDPNRDYCKDLRSAPDVGDR